MKEIFLMFIGANFVIFNMATTNVYAQARANRNALVISTPLGYVENIILQNSDRNRMDSGTRTGGSDEQEYLSLFCNTANQILKDARSRMNRQVRAGNIVSAILTAKNGLRDALNVQRRDSMPATFTLKALETGLEVATILALNIENQEERKQDSVRHFLTGYYDFVIDTVITDMDQRNLIPLLVILPSCGTCAGEILQLEQRYTEYVKEQIDLLFRTSLGRIQIDGIEIYSTVGNDRQFLQIANVMVNKMADELNSTLWNAHYACHIQSLRLLSEQLGQFLISGQRDIWEDERYAVNDVAVVLHNTVLSLSNQCNL